VPGRCRCSRRCWCWCCFASVCCYSGSLQAPEELSSSSSPSPRLPHALVIWLWSEGGKAKAAPASPAGWPP
jgi:hypothetical protein